MDNHYVWTAKDQTLVKWLSIIPACISAALCLFILVTTTWIWSRKHARPTIDRISFRLFWWSMGFELFYDLAFIVGESMTGDTVSGAKCAVGIYLLIAPMGVVNYLCTCIAINLMLIICFGVNPNGKRLERYYVCGSIALGFFIPLIPTALGHFGHDEILNTCWIAAKTDAQRFLYLILDLYLWQLLSCVVSTVAVAMTIISIFRLRRATSKAMYISNTLNQANGKLKDFDDQFLKMALRISMYPVTLIIVNGFISVIDLHVANVGGIHTARQFHFYCLYYFLYGGRGIFFALIGLIVDPCFRKGIKAAWRKDTGPQLPPMAITADITSSDFNTKKPEINSSLMPMVSYNPNQSMVEQDAEQIQGQKTAGRRMSEMDFMAAITQLAPDVEAAPATPGSGGRKEMYDSVL